MGNILLRQGDEMKTAWNEEKKKNKKEKITENEEKNGCQSLIRTVVSSALTLFSNIDFKHVEWFQVEISKPKVFPWMQTHLGQIVSETNACWLSDSGQFSIVCQVLK